MLRGVYPADGQSGKGEEIAEQAVAEMGGNAFRVKLHAEKPVGFYGAPP